jgi:hypothetical protein
MIWQNIANDFGFALSCSGSGGEIVYTSSPRDVPKLPAAI